MDAISLIELVGGAKELAKFARVEPTETDRRGQRAVRDLIATLRLIYFSPKGVLSLLEIIADGGYPSQDQVELVLTDFNDAEPFVRHARYRLEPDFDRNDRTLTLKAHRVLREISYGKGGVRSKVKELLNSSLTYREPVSTKEAQRLIDEIVALNSAIEEAEEALVSAIAKSGT